MECFYFVTGGLFFLAGFVVFFAFIYWFSSKRDFEKKNELLLEENKRLKSIIYKLGGDL